MQGVPKRGKKVTMLSGMVVRNFFTLLVLPDRTLRDGKSRNTGISGHFGPGRPLALREIPGLAENGKIQFPGARGTFGGESGRPKNFSPKVRNSSTFHVLADRTPTSRKSRDTGLLGHFGLGRHTEIPGGKQKNANSLIETEKREANPLRLSPNTKS